MSFSETSIALKEGIGTIFFGMNTNEVEKILGKPSEIETTEDDDDTIGGTTYHYDNFNLSLSFEEGDDLTLTSISATDKKYTVKGHTLIGKSYDDIQELRDELDLGQMEYDNLTEDGGPKQVLIEFADEGISFWFDDDELSEIQWGPVWNEKGDLWVRDTETRINDKILGYDEEYGGEQ